MANEIRDLTGKSAKFRDFDEIMNQPSMAAKLNSYLDEAVKSKQKIQFEQDHIKQIRETAKDELGLAPNIFNEAVSMVFNNDYIQRREKNQQKIDMIDRMMEVNNLLPLGDSDDE